MSKIKRYDIGPTDERWCKSEDVAELEAEVERLKGPPLSRKLLDRFHLRPYRESESKPKVNTFFGMTVEEVRSLCTYMEEQEAGE